MPRVEAHRLAASPPTGWDAQIFVRANSQETSSAPNPSGMNSAIAGTPGQTRPVMHLANFPLAPDRADFGGGVVELMGSGAVFVALIEHDPADARKPLFADHPVPWPLAAEDFGPEQLQRAFGGQAGCQRFFTHRDRAFCLYVVIGSHRARATLVRVVNQALAAIEIS